MEELYFNMNNIVEVFKAIIKYRPEQLRMFMGLININELRLAMSIGGATDEEICDIMNTIIDYWNIQGWKPLE